MAATMTTEHTDRYVYNPSIATETIDLLRARIDGLDEAITRPVTERAAVSAQIQALRVRAGGTRMELSRERWCSTTTAASWAHAVRPWARPCCGCAGRALTAQSSWWISRPEASARERLPAATYSYLAGGADDELTLADNVAAWSRYRLRPHVLRDVSAVDIDLAARGTGLEPDPGGADGLPPALPCRRRGGHGQGAAAAGSVFTLSTVSTVSIEVGGQRGP
jgi:hypothetical protein